MNEWMYKVLESKRQTRKRLAELSFTEKIEALEKLRDRSILIKSSPLHRSFSRRRNQPPHDN